MNRALIILVILGALGAGGYFLTQSNANRAAEEAAAAETVEAATEAAAEAVDTATEAASEAATAATEAIQSATEAATEAGAEAVEAVEGAADTATAETAVAAEAAGDAALAEIFTTEGFDFDQAIAALEAADISPVTRTAITTALEGARDNPAALETVLAQAREALGIAQ